MNRDFITGEVEGTGSAINISIGFQPKKVVLYNIDDAGALDPVLVWVDGMGADKGFKYLSIADNGTTTNKSHDYISSGGVTQYAGAVGGAEEGFTIGTDSDMNASGETIVYEASR